MNFRKALRSVFLATFCFTALGGLALTSYAQSPPTSPTEREAYFENLGNLPHEQQEVVQRQLILEAHERVSALLSQQVPSNSQGINNKLNKSTNTLGRTSITPASSVVTFASIFAAGDILGTMLSNFAVDLGAQGNSVVSGASTQLSLNMRELKQMVGDNVEKPITSLGYDAEQSARRLQIAIEQFNRTLQLQRQCLVADTHLFLATLQTTTEILKRGVLFTKPGAPRLTYFQFEGHSPLLVPLEGGRVTIKGFDLWKNNDLPPHLELWDQERKVSLKKFAAERAANGDEVTFYMESDLVRSLSGKIVNLQVRANRKEGILKTKRSYELFLPMVAPSDDWRSSLVLHAKIYYKHEYTEPERKLPREWFNAQNTNTSRKKSFNDSRVVVHDPECHIVRIKQGGGGIQRGVEWASATFTQQSITVNAVLKDVENFIFVKGGHSQLQYWVDPYVVCKRSEKKEISGETPPIRVDGPRLQLSLDIPKPHDYSLSDIEFTIQRVMPGAEPVLIAKSPRYSFNEKGGPMDPLYAGKQTFSAHYTPGVATKDANVTVSVNTESCGF